MTDQWEKYVEQAAAAMNGGYRAHAVERWGPEVRTVLEAVGPLIAEDARERLVAAAERAVARDVADPVRLTTEDALVAFTDRAAIRGEAAPPAVVLDSGGVPWLLWISEDGDTYAETAPAPDVPTRRLDFEGLLERNPAGVAPVWPLAGREASRGPLAAVRELHSAKPVQQPSHFTTWCDECQCSWPCHTAAILDGMVS